MSRLWIAALTTESLALLALAGSHEQPSEVIQTALVRARMCERLGDLTGNDPSACFTVGLFSLLSVLMGAPLPDLLADLPLSPKLVAALLEHQGGEGTILACVEAYERCDWDAAHIAGVDAEDIRESFLASAEWAASVLSGLD